MAAFGNIAPYCAARERSPPASLRPPLSALLSLSLSLPSNSLFSRVADAYGLAIPQERLGQFREVQLLGRRELPVRVLEEVEHAVPHRTLRRDAQSERRLTLLVHCHDARPLRLRQRRDLREVPQVVHRHGAVAQHEHPPQRLDADDLVYLLFLRDHNLPLRRTAPGRSTREGQQLAVRCAHKDLVRRIGKASNLAFRHLEQRLQTERLPLVRHGPHKAWVILGELAMELRSLQKWVYEVDRIVWLNQRVAFLSIKPA